MGLNRVGRVPPGRRRTRRLDFQDSDDRRWCAGPPAGSRCDSVRGIGTVSNVIVIGIAVDASLWLVPTPSSPAVRDRVPDCGRGPQWSRRWRVHRANLGAGSTGWADDARYTDRTLGGPDSDGPGTRSPRRRVAARRDPRDRHCWPTRWRSARWCRSSSPWMTVPADEPEPGSVEA